MRSYGRESIGFIEFMKRFQTEDQCREFLFALGGQMVLSVHAAEANTFMGLRIAVFITVLAVDIRLRSQYFFTMTLLITLHSSSPT